MKIKLLILALIVLLQFSFNGQDKKVKRLNSFKFESIFGYFENDSSNIYCMLGQGFLRTPRSDNSDSLINDWINKYPDAIVIPVSSFEPAMMDEPDSKMTYCWIVSISDTLNLYLIRQGCFPGGTMQKPSLRGMKSPIIVSYGLFENLRLIREHKKMKSKDKTKIKDYARNKDYKEFIDKVIQAEKYAKDNNLGIWNENSDENNK